MIFTKNLQIFVDSVLIICYNSNHRMERYRSGYNGTVLKTVVRQRTVGSNPTLSAREC